jgi:hypothetical protein
MLYRSCQERVGRHLRHHGAGLGYFDDSNPRTTLFRFFLDVAYTLTSSGLTPIVTRIGIVVNYFTSSSYHSRCPKGSDLTIVGIPKKAPDAVDNTLLGG